MVGSIVAVGLGFMMMSAIFNTNQNNQSGIKSGTLNNFNKSVNPTNGNNLTPF